ncbi:MAG: 16S rRNA (adenine(1518)-N(6)/adenine(1519)-N(6))-dimethyltransferase RsmA [Candidatus Hodarchaeota archaeon]
MNKRDVQLILKQLEVKPNKKFGQNFLIDKNVIKKIIRVSDVSQNDVILEIGPGLGALTEELAKNGKKIYGIEIDRRLCLYLKDKFSNYNNIEIINGDILEIEIPTYNKVISNIPYSITGPLLEKIFFKIKPPKGTLIIESTIANRIFLYETYKNYSRISISVNAFMKPILKTDISKNSFYPMPNITLSLMKIEPKENINPFLLNMDCKTFFLKFIAGIMPYKNKNIANAISLFLNTQKDNQYTKDEILMILIKNNLENKKVFNFNIEEFIKISKIFYNLKKIYKK